MKVPKRVSTIIPETKSEGDESDEEEKTNKKDATLSANYYLDLMP